VAAEQEALKNLVRKVDVIKLEQWDTLKIDRRRSIKSILTIKKSKNDTIGKI
jgi:hypothetical protein